MAPRNLTTRDFRGKKWAVVPIAGATRAELRCAQTGTTYCEHRPPFADQFLWLQQPRRPFQSLCVLCEPLRILGSNDASERGGERSIYMWPTTWKDVEVGGDHTTSFIAFARMREQKIRRASAQSGNVPTWAKPDYPGDDEFSEVPEGLLRHIARHDAPVDNADDMERPELLRAIWKGYGPVLMFTEFFKNYPQPEFMCLLTRDAPKVIGALPGWLQQSYIDAADAFIEAGDIRCGAALESCKEVLMKNRGFKSVSGYDPYGGDDQPSTNPEALAQQLRDGIHGDRAAIVVYFELGFADHVLTIMRLQDPTYRDRVVMRDFVCQAYIFQYALLVEEVRDVSDYLEQVAALQAETDPDAFLILYENLFRVRLSRAPRDNEWLQKPLAYIVVGNQE